MGATGAKAVYDGFEIISCVTKAFAEQARDGPERVGQEEDSIRSSLGDTTREESSLHTPRG